MEMLRVKSGPACRPDLLHCLPLEKTLSGCARDHPGAVPGLHFQRLCNPWPRSLCFVLAGVIDRSRFLRLGLAAILIFFGARLLLSDFFEVPPAMSLGVIAAALALSVAASIKWPNAPD